MQWLIRKENLFYVSTLYFFRSVPVFMPIFLGLYVCMYLLEAMQLFFFFFFFFFFFVNLHTLYTSKECPITRKENRTRLCLGTKLSGQFPTRFPRPSLQHLRQTQLHPLHPL